MCQRAHMKAVMLERNRFGRGGEHAGVPPSPGLFGNPTFLHGTLP